MVVVTSAMRPLDWFTKGRVRTLPLRKSGGSPLGVLGVCGLSSGSPLSTGSLLWLLPFLEGRVGVSYF